LTYGFEAVKEQIPINSHTTAACRGDDFTN